ncbi:MAG: calcineurin-like phosphoesterase family protein [Bacteroidales bacterium]|nr:calcineurin-like phosphoesterase family protein [Bacteroidales bacterium]
MHRPLPLLLLCLAAVSCSGPAERHGEEYPLSAVPGATVYGKVTCNGTGIGGVVVSDGVVTAQTDAEGVYQLASAKRNGLVFVSVPSGYRVASRYGTVPHFWKALKQEAGTPERVDFSLLQEDQTRFTLLVLGDIHLFNARSSALFRRSLVQEAGDLVKAADCPVYGLTLGDMTWDWHWTADQFGISEYITEMNRIEGMLVYNTIGNHDHDWTVDSRSEFAATGEDWSCEKPYRRLQGPTCFSFNLGAWHFISLDDAIVLDPGDLVKENRSSVRGITDTDLEWLRRDLSYVPRSTPLIVSLHIPLLNAAGGNYTRPSNSVHASPEEILAPFRGYDVLLLSAHTHTVYNNTFTVDGISAEEWNGGAVCGDFWTSAGKGLNLCGNGAPGGYRIMEFDGGGYRSTYKALGKDGDYLFRSYDLGDGSVLVNVWDWKPGWTVEITEGGTPLEVTRTSGYDPLYLRLQEEGLTGTAPVLSYTLFHATASSAFSDLTVTVTDAHGRNRTETMHRPKALELDTYLSEQ